jgi:hypothetical protein
MGDLETERLHFGKIVQGRASPQGDRFSQGLDGDGRVALRSAAYFLEQVLEAPDVHFVRTGDELIARRAVTDPFGSQPLPKVLDVRLDGVAGRIRRVVSPDRIDEALDGDELVRMEDQMR